MNSTILGGDGSDSIDNNAKDSFINAGAGKDSISNSGSNVTLLGGTGDDQITLTTAAKNNLIRYYAGDGNDTIWGFGKDDSLNIWENDSLVAWSSIAGGKNSIVKVGNNTITLVGVVEKPNIIIGESGSSGGGSNNGNGNGNGSSGGNGDNGKGDGKKSGGKSSDADKGDTDTTQGKSATGKGGNQSSNANNNGGNQVSFEKIYEELAKTSQTPATQNVSSDMAVNQSAISQNVAGSSYGGSVFDALTSATPATNPNVYTGGNQVIENYMPGQKIALGALPTGYFFDGDNFALTSATGTLFIQNVKDKVIEFTDGAGNDFLKAYAATNAGLIDGRGIAGFEVIDGSDVGADLIFAGDNGSQLWGGNGVQSDTLIGGGGIDIFVGGKTQGADTFVNAAANDVMFLSDSTLEDIVATASNDNAVAVAFNTGNVVMVGSSEPLSAAFMLADGSAYRYNHATKSWQPA